MQKAQTSKCRNQGFSSERRQAVASSMETTENSKAVWRSQYSSSQVPESPLRVLLSLPLIWKGDLTAHVRKEVVWEPGRSERTGLHNVLRNWKELFAKQFHLDAAPDENLIREHKILLSLLKQTYISFCVKGLLYKIRSNGHDTPVWVDFLLQGRITQGSMAGEMGLLWPIGMLPISLARCQVWKSAGIGRPEQVDIWLMHWTPVAQQYPYQSCLRHGARIT